MRPRRRGGVLAVLALVVLFFLAAMLFARRVHASRVAATAQGAAIGMLCASAAASATEEALAELGRRLNDPDDELARSVRQERLPAPRALTIAAAETARALAADPLTAGVRVGAVRVDVIEAAPVAGTPWEFRAKVRLQAEARHAATRAVRRMTREHALRVSLLTIPRPFDQFTFLAVDARPLVGADANARLDAALALVERLRAEAPRRAAQARELLAGIARNLEEIDPALAARHPSRDPERLVGALETERLPVAPEFSERVQDPRHRFPHSYAAFSRAASIPDLAAMAFDVRATAQHRRVTATGEAYARARDAHDAAYDALLTRARPMPRTRSGILALEGLLDRWIASLTRLSEATARAGQEAMAQVAATTEFTDAAGELAGQAAETLAERAEALSDEAFRARATHRFAGAGAAHKAVELLARYAGERLHAIVHVEDERLDLSALRGADGRVRVRGRLVLATTGDVALDDVVVEDPARDHLTVVAGGKLTVTGRVQAALVARGGIAIAPDAQISGSLVLAGPYDPAGLAGRLDDAGNRHAAGVSGSFEARHTHAALSPWALARTMERE